MAGSELGRMMLEQPKDMLLYFEQRTGYVEIARDGNLEAIYFVIFCTACVSERLFVTTCHIAG
jgi:hypothetical protein